MNREQPGLNLELSQTTTVCCEKCGHDSHCDKECLECANDVCTGCQCRHCK